MIVQILIAVATFSPQYIRDCGDFVIVSVEELLLSDQDHLYQKTVGICRVAEVRLRRMIVCVDFIIFEDTVNTGII